MNPINKDKIFFAVIFLSFSLWGCSKFNPDLTTVSYEEDTTDILNPERGFYRPFGAKTSDFKPLDKSRLQHFRDPQPAAGGFNVSSTLTYRSYRLDLFKEEALTEDILDKIRVDLDIIREVGNKVILRFSYSDQCCDPPFHDVPKTIILEHLNQLSPVLQDNSDVIAVMQMGLIGPWGEQFYSDHFGDLEHGPVTDQHWSDRNEVIDALLKAVPRSRMIQVRAPYYKLRYLHGSNALPSAAAPLSVSDAFNGTPIARLAHHNDCILANYDDYWTYYSFHQWPPVSDTLHLKQYIAAETKYLVFGGETCPGGEHGEDVYDPFNNCRCDGGSAEQYLKRFHTSFLNTSWSGKINGDWKDKCIEDIKKSLGYRLVLMSGNYPAVMKAGRKAPFQFAIINKGYASPYNPRLVELVFRDLKNQKVRKVKLDCDPRYWFPDELQEIKIDVELPNDLSGGQYELFINLPDPEQALYPRPEYAIRLASRYGSRSIWDPSTGWNQLFHNVSVE